MEKRKPTYDLGSFRDAARRGEVTVTRTAAQAAQRLGFDYDGMMSVIESMNRRHFYKSMTAYAALFQGEIAWKQIPYATRMEPKWFVT